MAKKKLHLRLYDRFALYKRVIDVFNRIRLPLMGGVSLLSVLSFFSRNVKDESISIRGAAIAFNMFLCLFPALIFLFTLLPYIPIHDLKDQTLLLIKTIMPPAAFTEVEQTIRDVFENRHSGLLSVGLIATLYFSSNGVYALMQAFNRLDDRSFWKMRLVAMALTLVLGAMFTTALSLLIFGELLIKYIILHTFISYTLMNNIVIFIQWIIIFILLIASCTVIFRFGDIRVKRWRNIYPGAVLASFLIVITSLGYAFYVAKWGNYNKIYGSLGALIITMLWLYFNAMVIIIGHEFNRSLMHARQFHLKDIETTPPQNKIKDPKKD